MSQERDQKQNYEVSEASDSENSPAPKQGQANTYSGKTEENDRPMIYRDPREGEPGRERVRKTRIKDREKSTAEDSSLKIKIELDLEAEINLYARVKGDVTIGLL